MRTCFLAAGMLALAACAEKPNDDICLTPPPAAQGDWAGCVHRWAYRLAKSPGPNAEVAEAAVSGCRDAIQWEIDNSAEAAVSDDANLSKMLEDRLKAAREAALFRVVQARAGHCKIP